MNSLKLVSVILLAMSLSSVAIAVEEKFEENYKVEKPIKTERQIASEKESEREPSSVTPPPEVKVEEVPQPWLHKVDETTHH